MDLLFKTEIPGKVVVFSVDLAVLRSFLIISSQVMHLLEEVLSVHGEVVFTAITIMHRSLAIRLLTTLRGIVGVVLAAVAIFYVVFW